MPTTPWCQALSASTRQSYCFRPASMARHWLKTSSSTAWRWRLSSHRAWAMVSAWWVFSVRMSSTAMAAWPMRPAAVIRGERQYPRWWS